MDTREFARRYGLSFKFDSWEPVRRNIVPYQEMKIYFDQVPEDVSFDDYPPDTEFIWDDSPLKRDPETFKLIRPKKRKLIYPEDLKEEEEEK